MSGAFDIIVVGGGAMGLSTAYHCAKQGKKVLVLEQYGLFNQSGSSSDLVRMFRTMYTEDYMMELALQSRSEWQALERDAGESLILMTGLLNFGNPLYESGPEGNLTAPIPNLERHGLVYERLTSAEIMQRYPFKELPATYEGVFAPDNGCINVPLVLRTLHRIGVSLGVTFMEHAVVTDLTMHEHSVSVRVSQGSDTICFEAPKVALTTGAYCNSTLRYFGIELDLDIWEMVSAYYSCDEHTHFPSMWFQFENDKDPHDPNTSALFYGFPAVPWGIPNQARIAVDYAANRIRDPSERKVQISEVDLRNTLTFVKEHIVGCSDRPNFVGSCLQANVYDNDFVLDFVPNTDQRVVIFAGGWGFKFVPLIGRILQQLLTDGAAPTYDISHFKIDRRDADGSVLKTGDVAGKKQRRFRSVPHK